MIKETRAMEGLDKEIEEMESFLSAPQESTENEESIVEKEEPTKVITPLEKDLEAATHRFNKYKGSTDKTIYELRTELTRAKELAVNLRNEIQELKSKSIPAIEDKSITSYLSKEDQEILGETAVQGLDKSIKEMVNSQVTPLKSRLDQEAKYRKNAEKQKVEELEMQRHNQFVSRLASIVPDYDKIVSLPDFRNKYLKGLDEYSGVQRERLFIAAEKDGDVGRVASFFTDYKRFLKGKENILEESITPTGIPASEVREETPKWKITPAFIDKFYKDVSKGAKEYKGARGRALAQEIEAAIDEFISNGGHRTF